MTVAEKNPEDLVATIQALRSDNGLKNTGGYRSVLFPMVDYDEHVDISWLIGMRTFDVSNSEFGISQALQQTKFKMNQLGARVKSAVAFGIRALGAVAPIVL